MHEPPATKRRRTSHVHIEATLQRSPQSPLDRDRSPSYSIVLPIFFSPKNEGLRYGETERKGSEGTMARDSERARGIGCVRQKEAIIRTRGGGGWARNVKRGSKHRRRGGREGRGAGAPIRHATERMIGLAALPIARRRSLPRHACLTPATLITLARVS